MPPDATRLAISDGTTTVEFNHSRSDRITKKAFGIVESKHRTSDVLRSHGVPVPDSILFDAHHVDYAEVRKKAESLGFPVVLKPTRGSFGRGVFANITTAEQLADCYQQLAQELTKRWILLERHHLGQDFRIYVVGDKYVAACKRIPANVTGDGESTIEELIAGKNQTRRRNPFLSGGLIVKDYELKMMVARAGHSLTSVPARGEYVALREKANASAGGDVVDVTEQLPARIQQAAVAAVQAIPGLPAAGVDVLWNEESSSDVEDDFVVVELNSRAHIGVNMYPTHGEGQDVPKVIIDEYFEDAPRPDFETFGDLTFDRKQIADTIFSGVLNRVTLAPLPEHGYPIREHYTLSPEVKLARPERVALAKLAQRTGIACTLQLSGDSPEMVLGAENSSSLSRFRDAVGRKLGDTPKHVGAYEYPLYAGFRVI